MGSMADAPLREFASWHGPAHRAGSQLTAMTRYTYAHPRPALTVDCVLFRTIDDVEQVLLIRRARLPYRDCWALPGGFVGIDESLAAAAERELAEETGITGVALAQLYAFGRVDRDPRERVVSIAYWGDVADDVPVPVPGGDAKLAAWWPLDGLPELAFDHAEIIARAVEQRSARGKP